MPYSKISETMALGLVAGVLTILTIPWIFSSRGFYMVFFIHYLEYASW